MAKMRVTNTIIRGVAILMGIVAIAAVGIMAELPKLIVIAVGALVVWVGTEVIGRRQTYDENSEPGGEVDN